MTLASDGPRVRDQELLAVLQGQTVDPTWYGQMAVPTKQKVDGEISEAMTVLEHRSSFATGQKRCARWACTCKCAATPLVLHLQVCCNNALTKMDNLLTARSFARRSGWPRERSEDKAACCTRAHFPTSILIPG